MAAALLLLGAAVVAGTVLRIRTADGTLVVEVTDPSVNVTVDGQEVIISGTGIAEIRLRAGQHKVQANKDGKPVLTKLVDVKRDGKEVVRVSAEPTGAGSAGDGQRRRPHRDFRRTQVAGAPGQGFRAAFLPTASTWCPSGRITPSGCGTLPRGVR